MIVCHCNCIKSACIERCAREMAEADPACAPTPVAVYQGLGKRPCCGGCLPLAARLIAAMVDDARASATRRPASEYLVAAE